jgi:hypothetical protein
MSSCTHDAGCLATGLALRGACGHPTTHPSPSTVRRCREAGLGASVLRTSEQRGTYLRLRHTKTGDNKSVRVLDHSTITLLREVVATTAPGALLFPFTAAEFRASMHRTCALLGLSSRYVPHSLRHGGATRYYTVLGMAIADVMVRGRWAAQKSALIYIQSGLALLAAMTVPERLGAMAVRLAHNITGAFAYARARHRGAMA